MEYVVEKIVGKRMRNGKAQYEMEWTGYGSESNTWESIDENEFAEMIIEFHCANTKKILAYQKLGADVNYMIKGNGRDVIEILPSSKLREYQSEMIVEFLQAHIRWENRRQVTFAECSMAIKVRPGPIKPEEIVYVTDCSGELVYFVQYPNKSLKYIAAIECEAKWPDLIIDFLENFLN